ncbi:MAG: hypothetical protein J6A59_03740 [Lachnospiraceae bacterium]|nr:hypothetical protein [Lachnospiraceae bacterium]
MAIQTSIMRHKQYATYQACLDIYSDSISTEESYKKAFLHIIHWLKKRMGAESISNCDDLAKYPSIEEYQQLSMEEMYGFSIDSQMDIRLYNLQSDNSWAMKITEPDNRVEFTSGSKTDGAEIYGRTFITEIALHMDESKTTLAVQIICQEPITNNRDAMSFRPAFINNMFKDKDFEIVEGGIDRQFCFHKVYEDNWTKGSAIKVDESNVEAFVDGLLANDSRQMPVVLCPEYAGSITYETKRFINGEEKILEGDVNSFAYSLMGYAHVAVISDSVLMGLFDDERLTCVGYEEKLQSKYVIYHTGVDPRTGLFKEPVCCSLAGEDVYLEDDEFYGKQPLEIIEGLAKNYSVRKTFSFGEAKFYRELKKQYYRNEGKGQIAETIANLEKDIAEKETYILDLQYELERKEKEYKETLTNWRNKFGNSQERVRTCEMELLELRARIKEDEQSLDKTKKEYDELIRKKNLEIASLSKAAVQEPDKDRMDKFYRSAPKVLLACHEDYMYDFVKYLMIKEINDVLYEIYASLNARQRRYELIEVVLQYNKFAMENGISFDGLLCYPDQIEFYEGEFKDVIYDALYEYQTPNKTIDYLLDYNQFDMEQQMKKERLFDKINGYRQVKSIMGVLNEVGLAKKSSNSHDKFLYYGDERYQIDVACTPSDTNAGKNVVTDICKTCL